MRKTTYRYRLWARPADSTDERAWIRLTPWWKSRLLGGQTGTVSAPAGHVAKVMLSRRFGDDEAVQLAEDFAGLTSLWELGLRGAPVTDAGLKHLVGLTSLRSLALGCDEGSGITDAGLAELAKLRSLEELLLYGAHITDAGLAHLATLTVLQKLDLSNTPITDAGLPHLARIASLRWVNLTGTAATDAGFASLTQARPDLDVGMYSR